MNSLISADAYNIAKGSACPKRLKLKCIPIIRGCDPKEFNAFLWMPPSGTRGGDILLADSTVFTTLFGGTASLDRFWRNLATA